MTPHIEAPFGSIASCVIISGDPLRTQAMSKKFLINAILVSKTRNMLIYTGYYQGLRVSFASGGIGVASMAVYVYELYKFYNVQIIIRTGSCGSLKNDYELGDVLNVHKAFAVQPYLQEFYSQLSITVNPEIETCINETAKKIKIPLISNINALTDENFYFFDHLKFFAKKEIYNLDVVEMESYILFVYALLFQKDAACLLTVTDLLAFHNQEQKYKILKKSSPQERSNSLFSMFKIALETCLIFYQKKIK